ncbi:MAG: hypothetical protein SW833_28400 [Cyanobacteriota bacterium]|nr:hypothetical protein [Cyanobacteriota bacterium]
MSRKLAAIARDRFTVNSFTVNSERPLYGQLSVSPLRTVNPTARVEVSTRPTLDPSPRHPYRWR